MNEDDLISATLHRAVSTLEPPTARLVAGGIARGRRRRRAVIGAEVLTGAALVAGVLAMVAAFVPAGGGGTGAADGSTSASVRSSGGSSTAAPQGPATVAMTPQALLQTALDTLPHPGRTSAYSGNVMAGWAAARFLYDDGQGAAQIDVALVSSPDADANAVPCPAGSDGCTVLSDGVHVKVWQGREYSDGRTPNATEYYVVLARPDGVAVEITEWNAPQEKGAALTRAEPPFTIAELTAWAHRGQWTAQISRERAAAAAHLFAPTDLDGPPDPAGSSAAVQKRAGELEREAADREKAAKLAQQRAECAAAKAAHQTLPGLCATIK